MLTLLVTDRNLIVQGDPLDGAWTSLTVTRNDNAPDSGSLQLVAWPEVMTQLQPGNRLVVIRDGTIWTSGPLEIPLEWELGIGGDSGGQDAPEPGEVTVSFSSDDALIAGRLTYPDPTLAASSASQPANYVRTAVNAEVLMRDVVNLNAGPGALAARRIPRLVLGALASVGTTTSLTTRFQPLYDVLRSTALAGGDLGFGTQQVGSSIEFRVWGRRDLRSTARFSWNLNNLRYLKAKVSAPTVTSAIVGGSGTGTARKVVEITDAAAVSDWWRVEQWVDQGGVADDTNGELTKAGNEALASGAQPVELSTVTVDTEDLQAGRDYQVGDLVTVELPSGLEVADTVRSDTLTATPNGGELVTCTIGTPDATTARATVVLIRELAARLGRIETR